MKNKINNNENNTNDLPTQLIVANKPIHTSRKKNGLVNGLTESDGFDVTTYLEINEMSTRSLSSDEYYSDNLDINGILSDQSFSDYPDDIDHVPFTTCTMLNHNKSAATSNSGKTNNNNNNVRICIEPSECTSQHSKMLNTDNRTLIIFDWDDTLHPTSACQSGLKLDIESVRKFCLSVYETLLIMIRLYGPQNIYIVSNADRLWIQKCLNQLSGGYFVNIYHLISLYDIQIISAKNQFSSKFPKDCLKWKQLTFEMLVKKHYLTYRYALSQRTQKQFTVVSIGDSHQEYIASKNVIQRLNKVKKHKPDKILLHRVKLLKNPTIIQLVHQYSLINKIAFLFQSEAAEIDIDYLREMRYYSKKTA